MLATNDPLHPQNFLLPDERLRWSGRPDRNPPLSKMLRAIRIVGWVNLGCFALFAVLGWVNRDELEGAGGILAAFLALSLLGGLLLIWGIPWIARRGLSQTRYGVTDDRVIIVNGMQGPRVNLIRVRDEAEIDVVPTRPGLCDVVYGREVDMVYTPGVPTLDPQQRTPILRLLTFKALPQSEAEAAATALKDVRGKGGKGPIHEVREV